MQRLDKTQTNRSSGNGNHAQQRNSSKRFVRYKRVSDDDPFCLCIFPCFPPSSLSFPCPPCFYSSVHRSSLPLALSFFFCPDSTVPRTRSKRLLGLFFLFFFFFHRIYYCCYLLHYPDSPLNIDLFSVS